MYQADDVLKTLYQSDTTNKNTIAEFRRSGEQDHFLAITDGTKYYDMTIDESLSSSENLEFGACEASQVRLTLPEKPENIKGAEMSLYQTLDGLYPAEDLYPGEELYPSGYIMPLGCYVVQSVEQQANQKYWDLVALDFMSKFDVNVIDWYNGLTFPMTLRSFRASLCRHLGITEEVPDYLPNDGMLVEKTIDTAELLGRTVLIACEQANGVFGHFDRSGVLQHVALQPNDCLVPALDLYPDEGLYPVLPGEMNTQTYDEQIDPYLLISCQFEEHTVQSIDKVQIRQEEGDIGAIYGGGTNCYTVEGNFLMYGKGAEELGQIARNLYGMISGRMYRPYESQSKGLPYIEVGDALKLDFGGDSIVSYVIKRTLKGIYALKDSYSATGEEIRSTESNINTDIIQLKGKAAILKRNVEEVSANLIDLENNTEAKFAITASQITAEVKRAQEAEASLKISADQIATSVKDLKSNTESQIKQLANDISLKVSSDNLLSSLQLAIDQEGAYIKMTTGHFIFEGQNFYVNADGSGGAANGNFTWDANGKVSITGATINGALVSGTNSSSVMSCQTIGVVNADIDRGYIDQMTCGTGYSNSKFYADVFVGDLDGEIVFGSDLCLKRDIRGIDREAAVQIIKELKPVSFEWVKNGKPSMGFIAQDVVKLCGRSGVGLPLYGSYKDYYTIPYINYIPLLVSAAQVLIADLERRKRASDHGGTD